MILGEPAAYGIGSHPTAPREFTCGFPDPYSVMSTS